MRREILRQPADMRYCFSQRHPVLQWTLIPRPWNRLRFVNLRGAVTIPAVEVRTSTILVHVIEAFM